MRKIKYVFLVSVSLISLNLIAAPKSDLWSYWNKNEQSSQKTINHAAWTEFLQKYIVEDKESGVNLVKYSQVGDSDKNALKIYLKYLQDVKILEYNKDEQFVYWINLYNSLTINLILENYPLKSITDIKSGWFSFGPWDKKIAKVDGKEITLNDIEHRILRPIWKDNRIHYALNCASMSCPNLQSEAYTVSNYNELLNKAVPAYINNPRGVEFKNETLYLSSIYDWYKSDFASNDAGLLKYLSKYAVPNLSKKLKAHTGKIYYHYNWNLNEYKAK